MGTKDSRQTTMLRKIVSQCNKMICNNCKALSCYECGEIIAGTCLRLIKYVLLTDRTCNFPLDT